MFNCKSEMTTSRYKRRQRAKWKNKLEKVRMVSGVLVRVASLFIVAIGVPYLIFVTYNALSSSDYFRLKEINVRGNHFLTRDYVVARGDIVKGTNIFDLDEGKIEDALVSDPWIAGVQLETHFPDTLHVTVTEYQPVAMLVRGNQWQLVDATGLPFKTFEATDPAEQLLNLPLITGPTLEEMNNEEVRRLVVKGIELYHNFRTLPVSERLKISEVHIDPVIGLTMVLSDGLRVQLGEGTQMRQRLVRLQVVLNHLGTISHPDYILIDQDSNIDKITVGSYSS